MTRARVIRQTCSRYFPHGTPFRWSRVNLVLWNLALRRIVSTCMIRRPKTKFVSCPFSSGNSGSRRY